MRRIITVLMFAVTTAACWAQPKERLPSPEDVAARLLGSPVFRAHDILRGPELAERLARGDDAVSRHVRDAAGQPRLRAVADLPRDAAHAGSLRAALAGVLNVVVTSDSKLPQIAKDAGIQLPPGSSSARSPVLQRPVLLLNRRCLEGTYAGLVGVFSAPAQRGPAPRRYGTVSRYGGSQGFAEFDSSAVLSSLVLRGPTSLSEPIGLSAAERAAVVWLKGIGVVLNGWVRVAARPNIRLSGTTRYLFEWQRIAPNGVVLPSVMRVETEAGGELRSFFRVDVPAQVSLEPTISREEAVRLGTAATSLDARLVSDRCRVWFDDSGKQVLWWQLGLTGPGLTWAVTIDAHAGHIVQASPSAGEPSSSSARPLAGLSQDASRVQALEVISLVADGHVVGGLLDPLAGEAQVIGRIEASDASLGQVRDAIRAGLAHPQSGGPPAGEPPIWLRMHVAGADYVYHAAFYPDDGLLEVRSRDRWPQDLSAPREAADPLPTSVVCQVPAALTEAVLQAIDPAVRTDRLRGRHADDRSPVTVARHAPMSVALAAVAVLGVIALAGLRGRAAAGHPFRRRRQP